jgi:pyruvate-formate lyase-activating enzyme
MTDGNSPAECGGLTITGGESMRPIKFTREIFRRARHDLGLHTCLDTSRFLGDRASCAGAQELGPGRAEDNSPAR